MLGRRSTTSAKISNAEFLAQLGNILAKIVRCFRVNLCQAIKFLGRFRRCIGVYSKYTLGSRRIAVMDRCISSGENGCVHAIDSIVDGGFRVSSSIVSMAKSSGVPSRMQPSRRMTKLKTYGSPVVSRALAIPRASAKLGKVCTL